MRATPGLVGVAGVAAGLTYLLNRQRRERRRSAVPAAANRAARSVTELAEDHPWVFGGALSVLTAGIWRFWRRDPGKMHMAPPIERVDANGH